MKHFFVYFTCHTIEEMTILNIPYMEDLSFIQKENIRGLLKTALREINNNQSLYYLFNNENVIVYYENDAFDPILHALEYKCENIVKNDKKFYGDFGTYSSILSMLEYIIIDGFECFQINYDHFYGSSFARAELSNSDDSEYDSDNSDE